LELELSRDSNQSFLCSVRPGQSAVRDPIGLAVHERSYDAVAMADYPDTVPAIAVSVAARGAGAVHLTMTPLVTPAEMDQAIEKSATLAVPGCV
jgi:hypothetical protein